MQSFQPSPLVRLAFTAVLLASASPATAAELVGNGSFSAGNTGFSSDYADRTSGPQGVLNGSYAIGTDAAAVPNASFDWGGFGDHTTGTGNMLIADGALGRAWYQTVSLISGTTYDWAFWAHTVQGNSGPGALLAFQIGGVALSGPLGLPANSSSQWQQLAGSFTANFTGDAVLSISDANGAGAFNDFALDDISFASRAVPGSVPEPASWGLMLAGMGLVGGGLRSRRRTAVTYA